MGWHFEVSTQSYTLWSYSQFQRPISGLPCSTLALLTPPFKTPVSPISHLGQKEYRFQALTMHLSSLKSDGHLDRGGGLALGSAPTSLKLTLGGEGALKTVKWSGWKGIDGHPS